MTELERLRDKLAFITIPIDTSVSAKQFIRDLNAADCLFHFEDDPETIQVAEGQRTFSDAECEHLRKRVEECFSLLQDPFEFYPDIQTGKFED